MVPFHFALDTYAILDTGVPGGICASKNQRDWCGEGTRKPVLDKTLNNHKVPQLNGHNLI